MTNSLSSENVLYGRKRFSEMDKQYRAVTLPLLSLHYRNAETRDQSLYPQLYQGCPRKGKMDYYQFAYVVSLRVGSSCVN